MRLRDVFDPELLAEVETPEEFLQLIDAKDL